MKDLEGRAIQRGTVSFTRLKLELLILQWWNNRTAGHLTLVLLEVRTSGERSVQRK